MIDLDPFTVSVMTVLVASVASMTFIVETVIRRDAGPGRLWAVAFACGLAATVAYLAGAVGIGGAISLAVGNSLFVFVPGFVWLGSRRFNDRRADVALLLVLLLAGATFVMTLVRAPVLESWGGWTTMVVCLISLFVVASVETCRMPLRRIRTSWALSAVLIVAALYYAIRLVVFVATGPDDALFSQWLGSVSANIVTIALTTVSVIVTSVLRSHRTGVQRFEWLTEGGVASDGVMLARTFAAASADIVERASWRAEGVALIVIRVEGLPEIRTAFGMEVADQISGACRQAVRRYAPASAIVGEAEDEQLAVCTLASTAADARRLGATVYRGCMEELSADCSGLFPLVGVGVAFTAHVGHDLSRLQEGARNAARRAAETPGASVVLDTPSAAS